MFKNRQFGYFSIALQTALLVAAMVLVLASCAWLIGGLNAAITAVAMVVLMLLMAPQLSVPTIMRLHRARPIETWRLPVVQRMIAELSCRAGLSHPPIVYWMPIADINAFAAGNTDASGIAVSDGALRHLNARELVGVLAHEISHLATGDSRLMLLSEIIRRLTAMTAMAALLFIIYVDLVIPNIALPLWIVFYFALAPTVLALLQMAISRNRELAADMNASRLTGDPAALASALLRIEEFGPRRWLKSLEERAGFSTPILLQTHPPTEMRIQRLLDTDPSPPGSGKPSQHSPGPARPHRTGTHIPIRTVSSRHHPPRQHFGS